MQSHVLPLDFQFKYSPRGCTGAVLTASVRCCLEAQLDVKQKEASVWVCTVTGAVTIQFLVSLWMVSAKRSADCVRDPSVLGVR